MNRFFKYGMEWKQQSRLKDKLEAKNLYIFIIIIILTAISQLCHLQLSTKYHLSDKILC
jgi:hypothetical protein